MHQLLTCVAGLFLKKLQPYLILLWAPVTETATMCVHKSVDTTDASFVVLCEMWNRLKTCQGKLKAKMPSKVKITTTSTIFFPCTIT